MNSTPPLRPRANAIPRHQFRSRLIGLLCGLAFFWLGSGSTLAQTAPPGFTVSNYVTGVAATGGITGLAIDRETRTIYYADQNTAGPLRKIAPNRAISVVTANMAPVTDGFYPYVATDLEYYEGNVYYVDSLGFVNRINAVSGAVTRPAQFVNFNVESGTTIHDGILYSSDGEGTANLIRTLNLTTLVQGTLASVVPVLSSSLEYNAVKNRYFFAAPTATAATSRVMQVTPAGQVTQLSSGTNGAYNLAVEPNGSFAYIRDGTLVRRFDTTTGAVSTFVTGLSSTQFCDLVFGPSSSGSTFSLYIGDGTRIVEVAGFPGSNTPPTITAPDTIMTSEDVAANFTVTVVDAEGDPDEPPIPVFSIPAKGTITGTRTNFTYTPSPNANGPDSFTITADDHAGEITVRTVNVTIAPVNDAPVYTSVPATLTVDEDGATGFSVAASDVEGDTVTLTSADGEKGVVSRNGDSFTYTPNANANGSDSFTLTASDGNGGVTGAVVSVTIAPVNDAPVFTSVPETLMMNEDTAASFNVAASDLDGDTVTFTILGAARGIVTGEGQSYNYTPNLHANGTDSFTITANDGNGGTVAATVMVTIAPVNDAPVFITLPQTLTTGEDTVVNFNVIASDVDGDAVMISATNGQKGVVGGSGTNFSYTPNAEANGSDSFTVTASDGNGGVTSAEVTITITPINDAPVFTSVPTKLTMDKDTAATFDVTTSDIEGDPVLLTLTGATKGIVSGSGPSYTYTPNADAAGADSITVTADDGHGGMTTAIVEVTIVVYSGRYAVLLRDPNGAPSLLTLKMTSGGSLSGNVRGASNTRVPFRGTLPPPGSTSTTLNLKDGSSLVLEFDTRSHVDARLTNGGQTFVGSGNIALVPPGDIPGRYTLIFDNGSGGFGWSLMVVNKRGGLRFSGKLPDGSAMLAGEEMSIDRENQAPLFLVGKGHEPAASLSGLLHFAAQPESDVSGALTFRAGGADSTSEAMGAHFTQGRSALPPGSYPLRFEGVGVTETSAVILNKDNTATVTEPVVSLNPGGGVGRSANGLFKVKFRETTTVGAKPGPAFSGSGVFLQKLGKGFGQFVKDEATGQVVIGL